MTDTGRILKRTPIRALLGPPMKVLILKSEQTLAEGLDLLKNRNCTSAPVLDVSSGQYLGILSVMDVVTFLVEALSQHDSTRRKPLPVFLAESSQKYMSTTLGVIVGKYHQGQFPYIPISSIDLGIDVLFERAFSKGVHRVAVADADNSISHIITQSNAVAWISQHMDSLGTLPATKIGQLGFLKPVVALPTGSTTFAALGTLLDHKVHGLALIDAATGALVSTFSASDLKGLTEATFGLLSEPVHQCVNGLRAACGMPPSCLASITTAATFRDAVNAIVAAHVHRIFVVDGEGRPVGIISLTDIIAAAMTLVQPHH